MPDPSPTPGIYAYDRSGFTAAVISAGVYRTIGCSACSFPQEYDGDYFFSDFYDGFMRRLKFTDNGWQLAAPVQGQPNALDWGRGFQEIADYLNGPDGALWYCKMSYDFTPGTGEIRRVYYESPVNSVTDRPTAGVELAPRASDAVPRPRRAGVHAGPRGPHRTAHHRRGRPHRPHRPTGRHARRGAAAGGVGRGRRRRAPRRAGDLLGAARGRRTRLPASRRHAELAALGRAHRAASRTSRQFS